ncbi:MAG: hypothetical protein WCF85_14725 [Rhodospirillaceae bacterium]
MAERKTRVPTAVGLVQILISRRLLRLKAPVLPYLNSFGFAKFKKAAISDDSGPQLNQPFALSADEHLSFVSTTEYV